MDHASQDVNVVAAVAQIMAYVSNNLEDTFSSRLVANIALGVTVVAGAMVLGALTTVLQAGCDWWFQSCSSKNPAAIKATTASAMQQDGDNSFDGANFDEHRINRNLRRALQSRLIGVATYPSRCRRDVGNETKDTCQLPSFDDREERLSSIEKKFDQMTFAMGELQKRIDKLTVDSRRGECCASTARDDVGCTTIS
jgi:hypothetical protein